MSFAIIYFQTYLCYSWIKILLTANSYILFKFIVSLCVGVVSFRPFIFSVITDLLELASVFLFLCVICFSFLSLS